ncbi:putative signal transducing protein [Athalassotoga saccharophila]|uniref:putative signal transducing protein n=1 Tax=Athalassotoga saccharophila TaxID=1441386 RepID=UPI00137A41B0|nr:DUF2007 domain-containing protein [Athalassotoga saccharophila]BBJ27346.1 hypothetical protein ATHSA_0214 [Athalassotoga saccharophila]
MKEEWEVLNIFENETKAQIVKGFLNENGIEAKIRDSTVPYGGSAIFGSTGPKELLVKSEDLEEARSLINEINRE